MIEFERACELIEVRIRPLGAVERAVEHAAGWVLARDVVAATDMAPYRNSAMDGFAVRSEWLASCSAESPLRLPIGDTVFAGDASRESSDRPVKVMTGAMVAGGFDAVVPFEDTDYDDAMVTFSKPVTSGACVRPAGEDFFEGDRLMVGGHVVRATDAGVLAAAGLRKVVVHRRPSVRIVGTGDELVPPGAELRPGQTYDINTYTLEALVTPWAESVMREECVRDTEAELRRQLEAQDDVIVTSGGVSAGERDLMVSVAESCGWETVFHKVRIKPGKPVYFAVRGDQYLFGLPGNPLSAAVTCAIFVVPALKHLGGREDHCLQFEPAYLAAGESRRSGRKVFWPGRVTETPDGLEVSYSPKRSSAAISALLNTDGLIVQSPGDSEAESRIAFIRWSTLLGR